MLTDVYAKTEKGRAEVAQRSLGLNSRQRTVLILLDGRKRCSVLVGLLPAGQLAAIVGELLSMGLIVRSGVSAPATAAPSSARLAQVKAEMVETAQSCLGLLAAEVVRRIERAADERELLGVVGHWHMALQASKHGREAAQAHLERVMESLRAEPPG
ncbi:hypothetical protein ACI48D_09755 [Massilia sp. LXY-6]|uniref:hypothetical protein n=1 Tax=Massilia sp. LXY-6 TaxID=3379823 RepID=UPI003EDFC790